MNDPHARIARSAAARLAGDFGLTLPQQIEQQLASDGQPRAPQHFAVDAGLIVALAGLVLAAAQFGWTIYQDSKKSGAQKPSHETVARRIRVKIGAVDGLENKDRDRAIEVVVEEIAAAAEQD